MANVFVRVMRDIPGDICLEGLPDNSRLSGASSLRTNGGLQASLPRVLFYSNSNKRTKTMDIDPALGRALVNAKAISRFQTMDETLEMIAVQHNAYCISPVPQVSGNKHSAINQDHPDNQSIISTALNASIQSKSKFPTFENCKEILQCRTRNG